MSEAGSQQLLLDTQAIKALLLDFPSAGARHLHFPDKLGHGQAEILSQILTGLLGMAHLQDALPGKTLVNAREDPAFPVTSFASSSRGKGVRSCTAEGSIWV